MYSTLVGMDVTHKLHWTPGERVGVSPLVRTPVWDLWDVTRVCPALFSGLRSSYRQHGVGVVPGLRLPQLLPHLHQGFPGSPCPRRAPGQVDFRPNQIKMNINLSFNVLFPFMKKITLRAEAVLQSRHLYDGPDYHEPEPSESSPLLAEGR